MRSNPLKSLAVLAALLALAVLAQRFGGDGSDRRAGAAGGEDGFDFYVVALSWSPSYCEIEGAGADPAQCSGGRPYAFVLHGLWPQYEKGYPRDCPASSAPPDEALVGSMLDVMPAPGLVRHEWRAHGTCSGVTAPEYFQIAASLTDQANSVLDPLFRRASGREISARTVRAEFDARFGANTGQRVTLSCRDSGGRTPLVYEVRLSLPKVTELRSATDSVSLRDALARGPTVPAGCGRGQVP